MQIDVQHLVVDAGVKGDRNLVMQALMTDPNVPSANAAIVFIMNEWKSTDHICGSFLKIIARHGM